MTPTNGNDAIRKELDYLGKQVDRLWEHKASKEAVGNNKEDIQDLKRYMQEMETRFEKKLEAVTNSFGDLMRAILVACVIWALGSAGFLIGVLSLTN